MESPILICPVCSASRPKRISREGDRFYRCSQCDIVFNTEHRSLEYDNGYFMDDYRKQYGKSYEEDGDSIRVLSHRRLRYLFRYWTPPVPLGKVRLLDIGCALGFFLDASRGYGIGHVEGIEISEFAARYCRERFNIPVATGSFHDIEVAGSYHIITAWYFLEHSHDTMKTLKKIHSLLVPGGVFAFSAPSVYGPLFIFNRDEWERTHPEDHRVDFSPCSVKKIMKYSGFKKTRLKPGGIHPERVLPRESLFFPLFRLLYSRFSRWTGFSDTIEVFVQK